MWLMNPGPVLLRRQSKGSKYDPIVEKVDLLEANPEYAFIRFRDGRECTVSVRDLAPCQRTTPSIIVDDDFEDMLVEQVAGQQPPTNNIVNNESSAKSLHGTPNVNYPTSEANPTIDSYCSSNNNFIPAINDNGLSNDNLTFGDSTYVPPRQSTRQSKPPEQLITEI